MFDFPPSVERLMTLARGSLRQDLARAVRLWVILQSIYGGSDGKDVRLNFAFTYNEWRNAFFTQTQRSEVSAQLTHQRDQIPELHDPECNCAKSLKYWLFESEAGINRVSWCQAFLQSYQVSPAELEHLLETGCLGQGKAKRSGRKPLPQGRLFAVTGRQLQFDFADLVKLGWLKQGQHGARPVFYKVEELPQTVSHREKTVNLNEMLANVIETDAVDLFEHLGQPIRGVQRLFLDLEYIVPGQLSGQMRQFQQQLKQVWECDPVLPVRLTYRSARLFGEVAEYVTYPVCLRYFQRAPYLFAYGQSPRALGRDGWYDFRLDRIGKLEQLQWTSVHDTLRDRCLRQAPPSPQTLRHALLEAWGFDVFSPAEMLLVRFNPYFHAHYVENTERETLLKAIDVNTAKRLVRASVLHPAQQDSLLNIVAKKPKDIYCRVNYRADDPNVVMRLRAWGANVEVLLPWSLRSRMAKDMQDAWKLYQSVLEME
jgi:CRISPR-associated protein (TIGR03985 family)